MTTINISRAAVIAVLLLQYKHSRRGVDLNPEKVKAYLKKLEEETGFDEDVIRSFIFRWIIPCVLNASAPRGVKVPSDAVTEKNLAGPNGANCWQILAIKLLGLEHFPIEGIAAQITKVAKIIGVEEKELIVFYLEYVLSKQLTNEFGAPWLILHEADQLIKSGMEQKFDSR